HPGCRMIRIANAVIAGLRADAARVLHPAGPAVAVVAIVQGVLLARRKPGRRFGSCIELRDPLRVRDDTTGGVVAATDARKWVVRTDQVACDVVLKAALTLGQHA